VAIGTEVHLRQSLSAGTHSDRRSAGDDLNARIAATLAVLLSELRAGRLSLDLAGPGPTVTFDYESIRCILIVSEQSSRQMLSPRELQIVRLVAEGATTKAMAADLGISLWTVSTHVRRIFAKLDVNCRAEMVAKVFGSAIVIDDG
jgi:DNA-binding CsgD family transcriptional regulator